MLKLRLVLALIVIGAPSRAAEKITMTVTAVSRESQVATGQVSLPGHSTSNTSCNGTVINNGPMSTAQVNCQTNTYGRGPQTVTTHRLDVRKVVEANRSEERARLRVRVIGKAESFGLRW